VRLPDDQPIVLTTANNIQQVMSAYQTEENMEGNIGVDELGQHISNPHLPFSVAAHMRRVRIDLI
jgi:hypothetical protein